MSCTFLGKVLTKPYQQRQTADGNKCAKRHFILEEEFNTRHQQKRSRVGSTTSTDLTQLLSSVGRKCRKKTPNTKRNPKPSQAATLTLMYGLHVQPTYTCFPEAQYQMQYGKAGEALSPLRSSFLSPQQKGICLNQDIDSQVRLTEHSIFFFLF